MSLTRMVTALSAMVIFTACSEKPAPLPAPTAEAKLPATVQSATPVVSAAPVAALPPRPAMAEPAANARPSENAHASATVDARQSDPATLRVKRLVVAKNVDKREPVDAGTSFKKSELGKLYAFVEVENPDAGKSEVIVRFIPPNQKPSRGNVELDVGPAKRWRTWASTRTIDQIGTWQAVVTTKDGRELARQSFDVTE
jgi:hypothetical protein